MKYQILMKSGFGSDHVFINMEVESSDRLLVQDFIKDATLFIHDLEQERLQTTKENT